MNAFLLLSLALALILIGLTQSTEKVLNIRQRRRDDGEDLKTYL